MKYSATKFSSAYSRRHRAQLLVWLYASSGPKIMTASFESSIKLVVCQSASSGINSCSSFCCVQSWFVNCSSERHVLIANVGRSRQSFGCHSWRRVASGWNSHDTLSLGPCWRKRGNTPSRPECEGARRSISAPHYIIMEKKIGTTSPCHAG